MQTARPRVCWSVSNSWHKNKKAGKQWWFGLKEKTQLVHQISWSNINWPCYGIQQTHSQGIFWKSYWCVGYTAVYTRSHLLRRRDWCHNSAVHKENRVATDAELNWCCHFMLLFCDKTSHCFCAFLQSCICTVHNINVCLKKT